MQGWRFAFFVTAGMAAAAAVLNLGLGVDPRLTLRGRARCADRGFFAPAVEAARELGASLWTVGRIRSFQVIVLQVPRFHFCAAAHAAHSAAPAACTHPGAGALMKIATTPRTSLCSSDLHASEACSCKHE